MGHMEPHYSVRQIKNVQKRRSKQWEKKGKKKER